jgi:hypothetical protein
MYYIHGATEIRAAHVSRFVETEKARPATRSSELSVLWNHLMMEEAKGWISVLCSVRLSWVRPGRGAPYAWAHGGSRRRGGQRLVAVGSL